MHRRVLAATILTTAIGLASAGTAAAQSQPSLTHLVAQRLQKCYGVNAIGRNDCAAGAHSCAGQATKARDPASFVLLPEGDCAKIAGGALKPA
ncbi:MAG: DUF2282 domain-containing protein [Acetobacteraceae bacterium]